MLFRSGKGCVPGVEEAVAGGAAMAWLVDGGSGRCCGGLNGGERDLFSVAFSSVCFSVFGFDFFVFGLVPVFPSLSLSCVPSLLLSLSSLSPISLLRSLKFRPPLSPSVSPFIEKNGASMPFVSAPSITPGWSALSVVVGARRERWEGLTKFENGFLLLLQVRGGKEEEEQCRSKRHRSGLFFFFFLT